MDSAITKRKKKRKSKNAIVEGEGQSLDLKNTVDTGLTAQGNLVMEEFKIEDEVAPIENLAEGNVAGKRAKKRKRNARAEIEDGGNLTSGNIDPTKMDIGSAEISAEANVIIGQAQSLVEGIDAGKRKEKKKRKKKAAVVDEVQQETEENLDELMVIVDEKDVSIGQAQSLVEGIDAGKRKEKKKRKKKAAVVDEVQQETEDNLDKLMVIADEKDVIIGQAQSLVEGIDAGKRKEKKKRKKKAAVVDEVQQETEDNLDKFMVIADEKVVIENLKIQDEAQNLAEGSVNGKRRKKPKEKKGIVNDEVHSERDATKLIEIGEANVTVENPKVQDEIQSIENPILGEENANVTRKKKLRKKKMTKVVDELSSVPENHASISVPKTGGEVHSVAFTENRTNGSVNFEIPKVQDEIQSIENPAMDEGNVAVTSKTKPKKKKAKVKDELTENPAEVNVNISVPETRGEVHSVDLNENLTKESVLFELSEVLKEIRRIENPISDEGNAPVTIKKKSKKKKKKKAEVEDELSGRIDTGSTEIPAEVNVHTSIPETRGEAHSAALKENLTKESANFEIPKVQDEMQSIDNPIMDEGNATVTRKKKPKKKMAKVEDELSTRIDTESTENHAESNVNISISETRGEVRTVDEVQSIENPIMDEGNVTMTRKKKPKKKKKAKVEVELAGRINTGSAENLAESNVNISIPETMDEVHSVALKDNLTKESVSFEVPKVQDEIQSIENLVRDEGNVTPKKKKKSRKKKAAEVMSSNGLSQVLEEGRSATSTCNEFDVKDAEVLCCRTVPFASLRRKLLVLDLNGMLADIIYNAPRYSQEDIRIYGRAVFKRPFCDEFLKFCFQNFYVGIWSSRTKKIIDPVVSFLLGDLEAKLVFCWDMTHTTKSGSNTLENHHKPLVCKDLRKIWEHDDPSWPWKKGDYNESNTLLLDDSPYKALLNPPHTAIFPPPYEHTHRNDNSLGPGGDLRVYLEGLLTSENVQTYVKEHPFGQLPISEQSMSWEFYNRVINKMSKLN